MIKMSKGLKKIGIDFTGCLCYNNNTNRAIFAEKAR